MFNSIYKLIASLGIICCCSFSSCKDDTPNPIPVFETGIVSDVDGNIYKTIKIGSQWWMQENLKTTKFRNGKEILNIKETSEWIKPLPAYCIFDNNQYAPGFLYNYYCIQDSNHLAPEGWHIPTDDEWKTLEKFIGMADSELERVNFRGNEEGSILKSTEGWNAPDSLVGTNELGFSALAGGCRLFNGQFADPGLQYTGFWWSSTVNKDQAWFRFLDYKKKNIFRYYTFKNYGFSVRCVKD